MPTTQTLSSDQTAELLGIHPRTLANWRWRGTGPDWIKAGTRRVRYRRDAVEKWLDARTVAGDAA